MALFTLIFSHLQLIMGIILMFISTKVSFEEGWIKNPLLRYFGMEHTLLMIIGIILITVGYSTAKRKTDAKSKFKTTWIFYGIALVLILSRIPWGIHGASWY
jgi:low temperature requirement protein LtrA